MEFMRAISIIFVVINIYWFCYFTLHEWGFILKVVGKILLNFDRTAGLFGSILYTKLFAVVFLALSCTVCRCRHGDKSLRRQCVRALQNAVCSVQF
jgi:hypothetical protein